MTNSDKLNEIFKNSSQKTAVFADIAKQGIISNKWLEEHLNLFTLKSINETLEQYEYEDRAEINKCVWDIVRTFKEAYKYFADLEYYESFTDDFIEKRYGFYISESLKKS